MRSSEVAVLSDSSHVFNDLIYVCVSLELYPILGNCLSVMDGLSTVWLIEWFMKAEQVLTDLYKITG